MAEQKYAMVVDKNSMAQALGKDLPISIKQCVNICAFIRSKPVDKAVAFLSDVISKKRAVPYTKYNTDIGHKPGKIAAGRYPVKASTFIKKVVESAAHNAKDKGLNKSILRIVHAVAQGGSNQYHPSRNRGRTFKRTHIEIVVAEDKTLKEKAATKVKKPIDKKEVKEKPLQERLENKEAAKKDTAQKIKEGNKEN